MVNYVIYIILFVSLILSGCYNQDKYAATISGTILFRNPQADSSSVISGSELYFLDPKTTTLTPVGIDGGKARFAGTKDKIITGGSNNTLVIVDITTKQETIIYQSNSERFSLGSYSIAWANENYVSLIEDDTLKLINIKTGEIQELVNNVMSDSHSWCNGDTVYYTQIKSNEPNNAYIYSLNIITGKKQMICEGIRPRISYNGKTLVYSTLDGDQKTIVRDMESGKEWSNTISYFHCPSPDGRYVVLVKPAMGIGLNDGYTVYVWDYMKNKLHTVVSRYTNGQCFDIDWIN